jgi:hypothetical protein
MAKRFGPVIVVTLMLVRCGGNPSTPSQADQPEATFGPAAQVVSAESESPNIVGTWVEGGAQGEFRVRPNPPRVVGQALNINMCHSTDPNPGIQLHYHVEWGDGSDDRGFCRLSHVYSASGTFTAVACVWDEIPAHAPGACHTFLVTAEAAPFCHSINDGINGACPTGATSFCEPVPIVATNQSQAADACQACGGGGCGNAPAYFVEYPNGNSGFQYLSGGVCAGKSTAGSIIDPSCKIYGRWAP